MIELGPPYFGGVDPLAERVVPDAQTLSDRLDRVPLDNNLLDGGVLELLRINLASHDDTPWWPGICSRAPVVSTERGMGQSRGTQNRSTAPEHLESRCTSETSAEQPLELAEDERATG